MKITFADFFTIICILIALPLIFAMLTPFILSGWISKREREEQDRKANGVKYE